MTRIRSVQEQLDAEQNALYDNVTRIVVVCRDRLDSGGPEAVISCQEVLDVLGAKTP